MKLDCDDWRKRCTVDVDDVSVDWSYSALLPELLDEETQELKLKKLDFIFPTLSVCNDNLLYMMAKVDQRDDTAWVVVVDMKRAVVDALAPVSTKLSDTITLYCSCALPRYYPADDTVKTDDGSQDGDSMDGDEYWRRHWCKESLASWDFSEEEDDELEVPVKEEEEEEDLVKKEEDGQAVKTFFCQRTNAGADMSNPVDNHDKSHEIWQVVFDPDDNEHQQKKKKKRKRTRRSRRKKKQAQAQVPDNETELLDLLRFVCCILMAIVVKASIMAFPP